MKPVRSLARVMLSGIFVVSGARNCATPDRLAAGRKPVTDRVAPLMEKVTPRLPTDTETLVRVNAADPVRSAGLMLATGQLHPSGRAGARRLAWCRRPLAGHPFWNERRPGGAEQQPGPLPEEPRAARRAAARRGRHRGQAGLRWRAGHRIGHSSRSMQRAVRDRAAGGADRRPLRRHRPSTPG